MSISIRIVEYGICSRTRRHGQGLGTPRPKDPRLNERIPCSHYMLCMSPWPGLRAAVKPLAHVVTATRSTEMLTTDTDLLPVMVVVVGEPQSCVQQTCNPWQAAGRAGSSAIHVQ